MSDLIDRAAAIDAMTNTLWHYPNECYRNLNEYEFAKGLSELGLKSVPSAQPYTEAEIQKMQELEQAELQKAYECGRASAQQVRETGEWSVEFSPAYKGGAYCECSQCNYKFAMGAYFEPDEWKFCPNCGADMRGETE